MSIFKNKIKSSFGLIGFVLYIFLSGILLIAPLYILDLPIWVDIVLLVLILNIPFIGDIVQFAVMVLALINAIDMPLNTPVIICYYISLFFYALYLIGVILNIITNRNDKKNTDTITDNSSCEPCLFEDTDSNMCENHTNANVSDIENAASHTKKGKFIATLIIILLAILCTGIYFFNINSDYNKGYREAEKRIDFSVPENQNIAAALAAVNVSVLASEDLYFAMNHVYFNFDPYNNNYPDIYNGAIDSIESIMDTVEMLDDVYKDTGIEDLNTINSYLCEQILHATSVINDIYESYYSNSFPSYENMSQMMNSMYSLIECSKQYLLDLSEYLYLYGSELRQNEKYMSGYSKYIAETFMSGENNNAIIDLHFMCSYLLTEANLSPYVNMLQYSYDSLSYAQLESLFITDVNNYLNSIDKNLEIINENSYYLNREDLRKLNNDLKNIKHYYKEIINSLQTLDFTGPNNYLNYNDKYYEARNELTFDCLEYSFNTLDALGY